MHSGKNNFAILTIKKLFPFRLKDNIVVVTTDWLKIQMVRKKIYTACGALFFFLIFNVSVAEAQFQSSKYAALVVNADNGTILHQRNANALRHPASLTKMMTLYLTFEALERGKIKMNSMMRVSQHAAYQPTLNLGLDPGEQLSVRDAILGLVIKSANDASVVLADSIGGSEWQFAREMTAKAHQLGMNNTTFKNASGLPDSQQVTTAVDLAKLAIALKRDYPQYFSFFSEKKFSRHGVVYLTHNRVTKNYKGATGMKTGFVNASGFNLVTTATRGNTNLVGVVLGGVTARKRDAQMMSLLDNSFVRLGVTQYASKASKKNAQLAEKQGDDEEVGPVSHAKRGHRQVAANVKKNSGVEKVNFAARRDRAWAIQMGRYRRQKDVVNAVAHAKDLAGDHLEATRVTYTKTGARKAAHHSAKLANLTESEARNACSVLRSAREACTVIRVN